MRTSLKRQDTTCPNGGVFYRCTGGFVGCCLVEACSPGVGCPADKDTTPDQSSSSRSSSTKSVATTTAAATPTSSPPVTSSLVSSLSTAPTSTTVPSASSKASAVSQTSSTETPTSTTAPGATQEHSHTPTAAIVGAVLGGVILLIVIIGLFLCIRRRKRTKVYKAAVYPSPHVGSDMSPQLPAYQDPKTPRFAGASGLLGSKQRLSRYEHREPAPTAELGETLPRHVLYAELPANEHHVRDV